MEKTKVMIAGLPGKMATAVAESVITADDLHLVTSALAGHSGYYDVNGRYTVKLISLKSHKDVIIEEKPDLIVDFTNADSVIRNAKLYCELEIPFTMGTTGGDLELLQKIVERSNISAVVAPNMGDTVVAFQAAVKYMCDSFPGLFKSYLFERIESHQEEKEKTSGTMEAVSKDFIAAGAIPDGDIVMIRNRGIQEYVLGVPKKDLDGHGWHWYGLKSPDGNIVLKFEHKVNGRGIYAEGTLKVIRYLRDKIRAGSKGKVFSMIDVLKG